MFREDISYNSAPPENDPDKLRDIWSVSKGLQKTDGLETTEYLDSVIEENVSGKITLDEAVEKVQRNYSDSPDRKIAQHEADLAAANIADILSRNGFMLSSATFKDVHRQIFEGVPLKGDATIAWAGKYREGKDSFGKREPVLNGETVVYSDPSYITSQLKIIFEDEEAYQYPLPFGKEAVDHLSRFSASLWQVHPFWEGNTRTTAVFVIQYLRSLGFAINNDPFKSNSEFFRDALVRASYRNYAKGVEKTYEFLNAFYGNLLLGEENDLDALDLSCQELFE